jgi:hypothetical protein
MQKLFFLLSLLVAGSSLRSNAQNQQKQENNLGEIHGNVQVDFQVYNNDSAIGAPKVPEKFRLNGFTNLIYTKGKFTAGIRYENYQNALLGFDQRYNGSGIPFKFANYANDGWDITAGNYYEQFGSGLILRAYEERGLGYDNVFEGVRIKFSGIKGLTLKGLVGKQRIFFGLSDGIVRGFDGEISLNELIDSRKEKKQNLFLGGSFVSKYQSDQNNVFILPENVGAWEGRARLVSGNFNFAAEYVYKINDPSAVNRYIYKPGEALLVSAAYSQKGLGINLSVKRIDNMNFRSDRDATLNNLLINFLPALTRQHTYNLAATIYPYATQPNGELGMQADVIYTIKKGSLLGGNYGTTVLFNFSNAYNIDVKPTGDEMGYKSDYFTFNNEMYFQDVNIEINKKINKNWKLNLMYANFVFNGKVITGVTDKTEVVYANIGVIDVTYKINSRNAIRTEIQALTTKQDKGNWATFLAEYTFSPHWFYSVLLQYNYGNPDENKRLLYPIGNIGYTKEAHRIAIGYGRQRAGIFCVGGVCRQVPASNGLSVSITSSF